MLIAVQSRLDFRQAFPASRQQTLTQDVLIHSQQHRQQIGIAALRALKVRTGTVDQHVMALQQPLVDDNRDAVMQAVGLPVQRERAVLAHVFELLDIHGLCRFAHGLGGTGDDPPHHSAVTLRQGVASRVHQAVLA